MMYAMTTADYAYQGWLKFWQDFADFFWKADDHGLNYLSRIAIAIAIIVFAWLFIKLMALILRKALKIKKGPEIDVSMKYFVLELVKVLFWIGVAFLVASVLKFDLTGVAGITSAITVALGLALQDLLGSFFSGILILNHPIITTTTTLTILSLPWRNEACSTTGLPPCIAHPQCRLILSVCKVPAPRAGTFLPTGSGHNSLTM